MLFTIFLATFVTNQITTMNNRLKQFIAAENISQSQFADTIKVVRASVSHVLSGRNNPGYDFIKAIMTAYPALNMEWLILGKGKMYKENSQEPIQSISMQDFPSVNTEPELFADESFIEQPVQEVPEYVAHHPTYIPSYPQSVTTYKEVQVPVNQRKVVKVTIFFDDGTYQDM